MVNLGGICWRHLRQFKLLQVIAVFKFRQKVKIWKLLDLIQKLVHCLECEILFHLAPH
jgi:hypothetical protein